MVIPNNKFDVAVIGSGPAGSAAAASLSSAGLKILLIDQSVFPRYKTCGGGIINRLLKILPEGISNIFEKQFTNVEIFDHGAGFHYQIKRNYPLVSMTMREDFDFALRENTRTAGTTVIDNCELTGIVLNNRSVQVNTSKGDYSAEYLIAADGAQGLTSKKAGININKVNMPAVEYEVRVHEKDYIKYSSSVRFDFGILPGGYAWVFPKKNHLSIGLGHFRLNNNHSNLNKSLNDYLKKLNLTDIKSSEKHGFTIPISYTRNILAKGRVLLTGDAAALADPLIAEGITHAFMSGRFAAEAIIESNMNGSLVSEIYNKKIEQNIWPEIKGALILNKAFYGHPRLRVFLVKTYGIKFSDLMADVISGKKKYSELMKNPVNYLKLIKHYFYKTPNGKILKPEFL
jgi:geranylgeranyl reductase family protein